MTSTLQRWRLRSFMLLACFCLSYLSPADASDYPAPKEQIDTDHDGVPDDLEQQLLDRFMPRFHVSVNDCAVLPAEFIAGATEPIVAAMNGTIYGQAFPNTRTGRSGATIELHYFHLWGQDCGRMSHRLDAERVSALISAASPSSPPHAWRVLYWYAAAHESTKCDAGHGIRAELIGAADRGPDVWISHGKHASYLDRDLCEKGCGGDQCKNTAALNVRQIINLGQREAPMNGAVWVESPAWGLAAKMGPSFDEALAAKLEAGRGSDPVALNSANPVVKRAAHVGITGVDAVATGMNDTDKALHRGDGQAGRAFESASESSGNAAAKGIRATGRSLRRAGLSVVRVLSPKTSERDKKYR